MLYSHPSLLYIVTLFIRILSVRSTFHHAVESMSFVCIHDPSAQRVDVSPSTALDATPPCIVEDWAAVLYNARFSEETHTRLN